MYWRCLAFVLAAFCLAACGGLSGEPDIAATLPPASPTSDAADSAAGLAAEYH